MVSEQDQYAKKGAFKKFPKLKDMVKLRINQYACHYQVFKT